MELDDMDGSRIGGTVVNNLRYADDMVSIAESEEQLQRLINVVVSKSDENGLYLNSAKSLSMVFSKASQIPTCKILEQVHSFVYLGSQFTSDVRCEKEDWDREVWFYIREQSVDIKGYTYDSSHQSVDIKGYTYNSSHQSAEMLCVVNTAIWM